MSTDELDAGEKTTTRLQRAEVTLQRFRDAWVERDVDAFHALLTDDVIVHSPYLRRQNFEFNGPDQAAVAVWALFNHLDRFTVTREFAGEDAASVFFSAYLDGLPVDGSLLVRLDENGMITRGDMTVQDIVGLSRLGLIIAPPLLWMDNRAVGAFAWVMARMLPMLTRRLDQAAAFLLRRAIGRIAERYPTLPRL